MIYLDSAATSFHKPPEVRQAVMDAFDHVGNAGRGGHGVSLDASRVIYETRCLLADLFQIDEPGQIAFTQNVTTSLNIAIHGLIHPGDHVITTVCEHNSVLRPLYLREKAGAKITFVPTVQDTKVHRVEGLIDYEAMEAAVRQDTKAIVITHASNLTGNITDLKRVHQIAQKHHLLLIVDAAQTAGSIPLSVKTYGIDVLCVTGHKGLMGPQGTGAIYVRKGVPIRPLLVGGSGVHSFDHEQPSQMPAALEAGTLNVHGIAGLYGALQAISKIGVENVRLKEENILRQFVEGISAIDGVVCYGNPDLSQRTAVATINIGDIDSASVSEWLWENDGIAVRAGAHCAPLMHEALGTKEQGGVRFSFSYYNTEDEVAAAILAVKKIAEDA